MINIRMPFDCTHFAYFSFFYVCVYNEKDIRHKWTKPPYAGLHLDQQPREPLPEKPKNQYIIAQEVFAV